MTCKKSNLKKYVTRPGPPFPAQKCRGLIKHGNDNILYKSVASKNGIYKWQKIHSIKKRSSRKRRLTRKRSKN